MDDAPKDHSHEENCNDDGDEQIWIQEAKRDQDWTRSEQSLRAEVDETRQLLINNGNIFRESGEYSSYWIRVVEDDLSSRNFRKHSVVNVESTFCQDSDDNLGSKKGHKHEKNDCSWEDQWVFLLLLFFISLTCPMS